jgi:hypothetical protein
MFEQEVLFPNFIQIIMIINKVSKKPTPFKGASMSHHINKSLK